MKKPSNKKVTTEIREAIIKLHLKELSTWEIATEILPKVDLSTVKINEIINEYYIQIGKSRPERKQAKPTPPKYTNEQIEEQLIQQLRKGRPAVEVYRVAKKLNIVTERLKAELEKYGLEFEKSDNEKERC